MVGLELNLLIEVNRQIVVAVVAVAGLFAVLIWHWFRKNK